MNKVIFSGIQPSGGLHLGNYLGAIKQWVSLQDEAEKAIFCIVDLHAITVPQDPKELQNNILNLAAIYIAAGIDPSKSALFVQSSRPEHAELGWLLNCNATMGELNRMTQFKEKSGDKKESVSVGLYDYPILMAADILLYGATHVPVGDDQKQHVELTRDIALRFNGKYGETFILPEPIIKKTSARIMGLDNPLKKMSKSAATSLNYIAISDTPDEISNKVRRAVTDSGSDIRIAQDKPAITNLLNIFSEVSGRTTSELEEEFRNKGYGQFKQSLADAVIAFLAPIQARRNSLLADKAQLIEMLNNGSDSLAPLAKTRLDLVKKKIGLGLNV